MIQYKSRPKAIRIVGALVALFAVLSSGSRLFAQTDTLCAIVQLQIDQQATLEREGFDAHLTINNNVISQPLTNIQVQIFFTDANGNSANSKFFVKISSLTGTSAVDGTGVIQSSSTANIDWLIIPSSGTGGVNPLGQQFGVTALITGDSAGAPQNITTYPAYITVHPQPSIKLEYALPYEVFGQEPLLSAITPVVPYPLAIRATNVGYGAANDFQIQSAQPRIVDNKQGLLVDFKLLGTQVAGQTIPNTLLIPFGNIPPNAVSQASWIMSSSLSGRFISLTSTFTHASDLGGPETSLLQSVTAYTLLKDVLVDLPGRDAIPDYLVNETMDREAMQPLLDAGTQPPAQYILESDQPSPLSVADIPGALTGSLSGANAALNFSFTQGVSSNVWVHSYAHFAYGNTVTLTSARRADGKVINPANVWISKHFNKTTLAYMYWVNILDLTSSTNTYVIQFDPAGLVAPPGQVQDLVATTASDGGTAALAWTAPGEGGYSGFLFGGTYLIEAEISSTTVFAPANAQVNITTSTPPGVSQTIKIPGLIGNASYYFHLWTENGGGGVAALSNATTAYILPNPPTNLLFTTIGSTYAAGNWQVGNNSLPILYQVKATTAPGGVVISSSPPQDSFSRSYAFGNLTPNTTFFFSGVGLSSANAASSPIAQLGTVLTLAAPPMTVQLVAAGTGTVTATWSPGDNPPGTEFLVELSTTPDLFPPTYSSGWLTSSSFTFSGVAPQYVYSGRVKARNSALVESSYAELGAASFGSAISPAAGAGGSSFSISGANFGVYAGTVSTRVQFGTGGPLATIASWNNFKISGTVPVLSTGAYAVLVQRQTGASVATIPAGTFTVGTFGASSGPVVALNPFDGEEVTTSTPAIGASFTDSSSAISTASVRLTLDGVDVTTRSLVTPNAIAFTPMATLSEGTHTVTASATDAASFTSTAAATFLIDTIPPASSLLVDGLPVGSASPVVVSTAPLSFSAFDAGSGGVDTVYVVDADFNSCDFSTYVSTAPAGTCANPYFSTSFTLSAGTHTLSFYSDDNAGNSEDLNIVSVRVRQAPSPLILTLSPTDGSSASDAFPTLTAYYSDAAAAVDTTTVRLSFDGVDVTTQTLVAASSASFVPLAAVADGTHTVAANAADFSGGASSASAAFLIDTIPPVTTLSIDGHAVAAGSFTVTSTDTLTLTASDAGSGVSDIFYVIDTDPFSPACDAAPLISTAPNGTCSNEAYNGPFRLTSGTHTIYFFSEDYATNQEAENISSFTVIAAAYALNPSTGPIGSAFTITGPGGFGAYAGAATEVLIGGATVPVSVWNDAAITGTIPGLSTGTYPVVVQRLNFSSATALTVGNFTVLPPTIMTIVPSSGPIGLAFTLSGSAFGVYAGANTQVLLGGATVPISVWNDTTITGTVPGIMTPGSYAVQVERKTSDGGLSLSNAVPFTVLGLNLTSVSPSTGPIGIAFNLAGSAFGVYSGGNTQVLIGGTSAAISVWNDSNIQGTIPALSTGAYPLVVERIAGSGVAFSNVATFTVTALSFNGPTPSSGPIGTSFTLSGSGFGAYNSAATRLLLGGTTVAVSVWNDTTITGVAPAISTGAQPVWIERSSGAGVESSATSYFNVVAPAVSAMSPSTGPIGIAYTINGSGFGVYNGANTQVLIGGATTAISVWNNGQIQGTVPALSTGAYAVTVELQQGAGSSFSNVATFTVTALSFTGPSPSSGPVATSFTLSGAGFGTFGAPNTRLLMAGTTLAVSVWNDTTITAAVPTMAPGPQAVWIERQSGNGVESSATSYFTVVAPAIATVVPSSGAIGTSFSLTGSGFGTYNAVNTQVLLGGATCPISVWNDATITGTVPGILASSTGSVTVVVERIGSGGISFSSAAAYLVLAPNVASLTPSTGPIGIAFTLTGTGFGAYNGANTQVLIGGATTPISVWNDAKIQGTVPALASGTYTLQVERLQGGYTSFSNASSFGVTASQIASMTPSSAPIGAPFTISGASFGAYNGANTRVKFNGIAAPISVWNNTAISGTVPGAVSAGPATVLVEIAVGAAVASSPAPSFLVLVPTISTITPSFGPAGTAVTLNGFGFGPYAGASGTQLLVNGSTMPVAVWNDSTIRWTVPSSLANGTYPVVVSRTPSGGSIQSSSASFTVGTSMGVGALSSAYVLPLSSKPDVLFVGDLNLPAAEGGMILTPSLAAVSVPAGALAVDTEITLARDKTQFASARAATLGAGALAAAGEPISFGPEGTQFSVPVTITLPYDPALVPPGALAALAVQYYDPIAKTWTPLTSSVDAVNHLVSAKTSHFSLYQPLIPSISVASAAQDVFGLRAAYVFPNPARGVRQTTIRIQPGLADSVEVRVYDVTGRRVHSSSDFRFALVDDLNGLGAQDTYDHVWDVSGVGSGVYTFVITAKKSGQADIHVSGKIGVVR